MWRDVQSIDSQVLKTVDQFSEGYLCTNNYRPTIAENQYVNNNLIDRQIISSIQGVTTFSDFYICVPMSVYLW